MKLVPVMGAIALLVVASAADANIRYLTGVSSEPFASPEVNPPVTMENLIFILPTQKDFTRPPIDQMPEITTASAFFPTNYQYGLYNYFSPNLPGFTPPVPEPATWAMMIVGFISLAFAQTRRQPAVARSSGNRIR